MKRDNNPDHTLAVLAFVLAIFSLIITSLVPVLGPVTGLIVAAFLGGGITFVWADRRFQRRGK
jgi:hypothetical protein